MNNQESMVATVEISPSAPIGSLADFTINIGNLADDFNSNITLSVPVGLLNIGFEQGTGNIDWEFSGNSDWYLTTDYANSGMYSIRSGEISDNQQSALSVTVDVTMAGNIEFAYRVSSEYSTSGSFFYDGLVFKIDGQTMGEFQPTTSGQYPWVDASYPLSEGTHTLTWEYVKDGAGGSTDCLNTGCDDAAFVDDISFPPVYIEPDFIPGDLNADMEINVLDVILTVNIALGEDGYNPAGDLNGDGEVNVLDIVQIVNIILEQ